MSESDLQGDEPSALLKEGVGGFAGTRARDKAMQQADQKETVRSRKVKNEEDLVQIYRNHGRSCWAWLVAVTAAYAGYAYLWDTACIRFSSAPWRWRPSDMASLCAT